MIHCPKCNASDITARPTSGWGGLRSDPALTALHSLSAMLSPWHEQNNPSPNTSAR